MYGRVPFELIVDQGSRISFLYTEYSQIHREDNSLLISRGDKDWDIPAANLSCLMMGPGTSITQPALNELGRLGCSVMTTASNGVSVYSSMLGAAPRKAANVIRQARDSSIPRVRMETARRMYHLRWNVDIDDIDSAKTIREMMRIEGRRVKALYARLGEEHGVPFKRDPRPDPSSPSYAVNVSMTNANHMLYGICNAVILGMGFSPALGIVHSGNAQSFVFDVSDLFKESLTIPFAFNHFRESERDQRTAFRSMLSDHRLMVRIGTSLSSLFPDDDDDDTVSDPSGVWDGHDVLWNQGRSLG